MEEGVVRSGRRDSFTVLYNSMITDKRLSLKAKGLFAVMMSRPEGWEFSVSGLAAFTGVGKDAIRNTLMELERVGYLIREQGHKDDGTFGGNVYILQDIAPPLSGKPDNGYIPLSGNTDDGENRQRETPLSGNPTQRNKDLKKRKTKEPPIIPHEVMDEVTKYAGDDQELLETLREFLINRATPPKASPVKTAYGMKRLLADLTKKSGGQRTVMLAMIDNSIKSNWQGFFALKPDELPSPPAADDGDARRGRCL